MYGSINESLMRWCMNRNLVSVVFCLLLFMVRLPGGEIPVLVQVSNITIAQTIVTESNHVSVRE